MKEITNISGGINFDYYSLYPNIQTLDRKFIRLIKRKKKIKNILDQK